MSVGDGGSGGTSERRAAEPRLPGGVPVASRAAVVLLVFFLVAVVAALIITLSSVAPAVRLLAASLVSPILALTVVLLYFERRGRRWSFAGAGGLGVLAVGLRLLINTQPQLEVGGGIAPAVTILYVALGSLLAIGSLWAFLSLGQTRARKP